MEPLTHEFIHEQTGMNDEPPFANEREVRAFFTVDNMQAMFGGHCEALPETMETMAELVITNRWHCAF